MKRSSLILGVLLLGGGLLFFRLNQVGLFYWDQAYYSTEAKMAHDLTHKSWDELEQSYGRIFPSGVAKPTFILFLTLLSEIVGFNGSTILYFSAFCGWLCLLLCYLIGKEFDGPETGLWSAALLSVSTLHLFLARGGFPNVVAVCFYLLGFFLLLKRRLFISGLVMGLAYTCHYALLPNFQILALSLLFVLWQKGLLKDWKKIAHTAWPFVLGLLLVPIFWEAVYQLLRIKLSAPLQNFEFHTYAWYVLRQFRHSVALRHAFITWRPEFFPILFFKAQGLPYILLFLLSVYLVVRVWIKKELTLVTKFVLLQGLLLSALWFFNPGLVMIRVTAFFVPFQCLVMGFALSRLRPAFVKPLAFALILIFAGPQIARLLNYHSGYAQAAAYIQSQTSHAILPYDNDMIWQYHLDRSRVVTPDNNFDETAAAKGVKNGKFLYLVMDYSGILANQNTPLNHWRDKVRSKLEPIKTYANPMACEELNLYDRLDLQTNYQNFPDACHISIYNLGPLYGINTANKNG